MYCSALLSGSLVDYRVYKILIIHAPIQHGIQKWRRVPLSATEMNKWPQAKQISTHWIREYVRECASGCVFVSMSASMSPCATNAYTNERISIKISVLITFAQPERECHRDERWVEWNMPFFNDIYDVAAFDLCTQSHTLSVYNEI